MRVTKTGSSAGGRGYFFLDLFFSLPELYDENLFLATVYIYRYYFYVVSQQNLLWSFQQKPVDRKKNVYWKTYRQSKQRYCLEDFVAKLNKKRPHFFFALLCSQCKKNRLRRLASSKSMKEILAVQQIDQKKNVYWKTYRQSKQRYCLEDFVGKLNKKGPHFFFALLCWCKKKPFN